MEMSAGLRKALGLTGDHISENRAAAAMAASLGLDDDETRFEALLALVYAAERVLLNGRALADDPEQVLQAARRGVSRLSMESRIYLVRGLGQGHVRISTTIDELQDEVWAVAAQALTPYLQQLIVDWIERGLLDAPQGKVRYGKTRRR